MSFPISIKSSCLRLSDVPSSASRAKSTACATDPSFVEGDVSFENVQLDGALSIKAENGSKILLNLRKEQILEWQTKSNSKEEIIIVRIEIKKKETVYLLVREDLVVDGDLSKLKLKKK